ncbi:MAG TPA: acyl carrier protein [Spirochaetota bacterium]|nr:acyl carrier protein [Spirochaetota bacterium]HPJ34144.1 acyl carrier protein [Spirochaetota bacterium]
MLENIKKLLLEFICRNFMVDENDVPQDRSLVDAGIIDSIGLIEISNFMEKEFNIMIDEEHLTRENFGSVEKMVNFIKRQMES